MNLSRQYSILIDDFPNINNSDCLHLRLEIKLENQLSLEA